ncbi:STAS domain-containing protein [Baekduia soli]|uniref:STAS domain-containing protein n=1 Tax=Baekduia soli TaxID=496014 RepID=A0A5B8U5B4_9ACTN|nr:STAS domain-containing protein [Baekduia soli]QEC48210.1 STAS domain-containing protein [Baekduia soli]
MRSWNQQTIEPLCLRRVLLGPESCGDEVLVQRGTTIVVTVHGEVDLLPADALVVVVAEAIGRAQEIVVLDLAAVTLLDSAGLHALQVIVERARSRRVRLVAVLPEGQVREALSIVGLDELLAQAGVEN